MYHISNDWSNNSKNCRFLYKIVTIFYNLSMCYMQIYLFSICLHAYEGSVCPTSGFNTSDLQNILKLKTHFTIWSLFTVNNAHITYSSCYFSRQIGLQGNAYYLKHVVFIIFLIFTQSYTLYCLCACFRDFIYLYVWWFSVICGVFMVWNVY